MMGIGSEFTVCSGGGTACCIGVRCGRKSRELLVSFKSGNIQVYNVHDFRMVHSWQLPGSDALLCAAVTNPETALYWTIASTQRVYSWAEEDNTIATASHHIQHNFNPVKLLVSRDNRVPLIMYEDGQVGFVGGTTVSFVPQNSRKAVWSLLEAEVIDNGTVCVVGRERKAATIAIARIINGQIESPLTSSIQKECDVVGSCVCDDKCLLLCSNGEVLVVTLDPLLHPVIRGCTLSSSIPSRTSCLLALSYDYFIVATPNLLELWDNRYWTCQSNLKTSITSVEKVWCVERCVYAYSIEQGLRGWMVEGGLSQLSAALGKVLPHNVKSLIYQSWPSASQKKDIMKWLEKNTESASQQYLDMLTDREATPTREAFRSAFDSRPLSSDVCYFDVIKRLLSEKVFWSHECLSRLLMAGLVPSRIDILEEAVARNDWSLAITSLTHGPAPSEECLVNTVHKVFRLPTVLTCSSTGHKLSRQDLLYKVLSQSFNDVLMHSPLASLPFPIVKELLVFLSEYVCMAALLTTRTEPSPLSYNAVLDWIGLILDVHFTRLALDQHCQQLLLSLQSKILAQMTCFSRLSCVSCLEQVQTNWHNHHSDSWLYKVEKLEIEI